MLVFGTVQFGMAMAQKASLSNGARAGARVGAVNLIGSHNCGAVVNRARDSSTTLGVSPTQVEVTVDRVSSVGVATQVCKANANVVMASTFGTPPCTNAAITAGDEQSGPRDHAGVRQIDHHSRDPQHVPHPQGKSGSSDASTTDAWPATTR